MTENLPSAVTMNLIQLGLYVVEQYAKSKAEGQYNNQPGRYYILRQLVDPKAIELICTDDDFPVLKSNFVLNTPKRLYFDRGHLVVTSTLDHMAYWAPRIVVEVTNTKRHTVRLEIIRDIVATSDGFEVGEATRRLEGEHIQWGRIVKYYGPNMPFIDAVAPASASSSSALPPIPTRHTSQQSPVGSHPDLSSPYFPGSR